MQVISNYSAKSRNGYVTNYPNLWGKQIYFYPKEYITRNYHESTK